MIVLFLLSFIYSVEIGLIVNPNGEEQGPLCDVYTPSLANLDAYNKFISLTSIDGIYIPEGSTSDSANIQR